MTATQLLMDTNRSRSFAGIARSATVALSSLHPGVRLLLVILLLVAAANLSRSGLLAALSVLLCTIGKPALQRWYGLVRRTIWLLLSLLLVMAFNVPGDPIGSAVWAPTWDGVYRGALQAGHILLALGVLSAFLTVTPPEQLLVALDWLLPHSRRPSRLAIRLALTLGYVESNSMGHWKHWLGSKSCARDDADNEPTLRLPEDCSPKRRDGWVLLLVVVFLIGLAFL